MRFVLSHRHRPGECAVAYSAWRGFDSPLRRSPALGTCESEPGPGGEHLMLWTVDADSAASALALLPEWLADRTEARLVAEVPIP